MGALQPGLAMINGQTMPLEQGRLAITDDGVARGDGAFETVGVWDGRAYRLDDHLQRLTASLRAIGLPAVDLGRLRGEVAELLDDVGRADAALRLYVTASGTRVLTLSGQPQRSPARHLSAQPAPWIRPLGSYGPAGAKTMSYGPNMAATRAAQRAGADDALLVSLEGAVLEGPTFCVLWVADGALLAPSVELGIVDSISRRSLVEAAADAGHEVVEGCWALERMADASEVLVCSSVRDVLAVRRVDDWRYEGPTPLRDRLSAELDARRRGRS